MDEFNIGSWFIENLISIISIIIGLFGGIRGFSQFFLKQKQEIKIEKLKSLLEQNKLNDQKFRKTYEDFINMLFEILNNIGKTLSEKDKKNQDDTIDKEIRKFMKITLLFAGPETVKQFGWYRKTSGSKTQKKILKNLGNLVLAMRKDLGVSNKGIKRLNIIQTFTVLDVKKIS